MDINQMKYFIAVIENNFNLSTASKKLHLSQPALSQYILKFEEEENVKLFMRNNGRLVGLTMVGETLYANAQIVIAEHTKMLKELRDHSSTIKGSVKIGIPPLILTVLFTDVLAQLITKNPNINFDIIEHGAFDLRKQLLLHEVDFAILLQPADINRQLFEEVVIHQDQLTAFMSKNNPLAKNKVISWQDLKKANLAIFNDTFMIHHQLMRKFRSLNIEPKIALMSGSWDFLLQSTRSSNFITILPSPIHNHFSYDDVVEVPFDDAISWYVTLSYPVKNHYTRIERYTADSIMEFYLHNKQVRPIDDSVQNEQKPSKK